KSTAIQRFLGNKFETKYQPTVKNTYNKKVAINKTEYSVTIVDTAGQDETSLLDTLYSGTIDVYAIMFSVASQRSLEITHVIRDKILDISGIESQAMVLIGTKSDLKSEREVSESEAREVAASFGCSYFETSAKENFNIDEAFLSSIKIANKARSGDPFAANGLAADDDKSTCVIM
ncbi:GTP-binding protein, partial [Coemansia nantahalensis]